MKQIQLCIYKSCFKKDLSCLTQYGSGFHLLTLQSDQVLALQVGAEKFRSPKK